MYTNQHPKHLIPVPDLRLRLVAMVIISASASGSLNAEERYGWKLEWTGTTAGSYSETDDCASTLPSGACSKFSGAVGISGQSSGSFVLDQYGVIVSGSSEGRSNSFLETTATGECQVGDGEFETTQYNYRSDQSTDLRGPSIGDTITIYERTNESGSKEVYFNATNNGVCHFFATETASGVSQSLLNEWACEPYDYTNVLANDTYDPCPSSAWSGSGWATGTALATDEDNLVFSGARTEIAGYLPAGVFNTVTEIPYTNTISVTATKIPLAAIHGIELTQAIQVYQKLDQFREYLVGNDGNPPVPLVAYKPLAIRVALEQPPETVDVFIEAYWNGAALQSPIRLTQSSACFPPDIEAASYGSSRENPRPDCRTADFYVVEPEPGMNDLRIVVRTEFGNMSYEERLAVRTKVSDSVVVGAVNICATKNSIGRWECLFAPVREVERGVRLMREIYPTDQVSAVPTGHQVRLEVVANQNGDKYADGSPETLDCYDRNGKEVFGLTISADGEELLVDNRAEPLSKIVKCESDMWWYVAAERVERLYAVTNRLLEWTAGLQWFYFGVFKWDPLHGPWSGQAADIPEPGELATDGPIRGAIGVAGQKETERDVKETVAHEIGHVLGRRHTNLEADKGLSACSIAEDSKTDYPATYPDSGLWSGNPLPDSAPIKNEVGYHVKRKSIRNSRKYFDIMSYCSPNWVTPFTYKKLHDVLDPPPTPPPGEAGKFWLISGFVSGEDAYLDAIYSIDTTGPVEEGMGDHRIEVRDVNGNALFNRMFTPKSAQRDPMDPAANLRTGLSFFAELVPVYAEASNIVVVDETESIISEQKLSGAAPAISITFPNGGEQLDGLQNITWSATDPDTETEELFYWIQFSQDGGNSWINLAQDVWETSVAVDFDQLPGSQNALLRVLGTDGVNTGAATSAGFTVSGKMPTAEIALPEQGQSEALGDIVFFEGYGYDPDDGLLPVIAHEWSSDRDGLLATGNQFGTSHLSEGTHTIELVVTDRDGNMATDSVVLSVGAPTDTDGDGVEDSSDSCPATPAGEPVDATGCSASQIDSDGDGVSDALDQCAGTPAGTVVGSNGCTVSQPSGGSSSGSGGGSVGFVGLLALGLFAAGRKRYLRLPKSGTGNDLGLLVEPLHVRNWPLAAFRFRQFQAL